MTRLLKLVGSKRKDAYEAVDQQHPQLLAA
jgi:hypothetical protein